MGPGPVVQGRDDGAQLGPVAGLGVAAAVWSAGLEASTHDGMAAGRVRIDAGSINEGPACSGTAVVVVAARTVCVDEKL